MMSFFFVHLAKYFNFYMHKGLHLSLYLLQYILVFLLDLGVQWLYQYSSSIINHISNSRDFGQIQYFKIPKYMSIFG